MQASAATSAGDDTGHSGCPRSSSAIVAGAASAYPIRSPARPQVLVRLRSTTSPGTSVRPASDSRSPGTASMKASSTTRVRPGRASAAIEAAGCSTEVGLVGFPITTRSASSGTAAGSSRKPSSSRSSTRSTACPASRSAASGSVNCGCTTTGRRAGSARASSTKASAAPAVSSTRFGGRSCRSATAARATRSSG